MNRVIYMFGLLLAICTLVACENTNSTVEADGLAELFDTADSQGAFDSLIDFRITPLTKAGPTLQQTDALVVDEFVFRGTTPKNKSFHGVMLAPRNALQMTEISSSALTQRMRFKGRKVTLKSSPLAVGHVVSEATQHQQLVDEGLRFASIIAIRPSQQFQVDKANTHSHNARLLPNQQANIQIIELNKEFRARLYEAQKLVALELFQRNEENKRNFFGLALASSDQAGWQQYRNLVSNENLGDWRMDVNASGRLFSSEAGTIFQGQGTAVLILGEVHIEMDIELTYIGDINDDMDM